MVGETHQENYLHEISVLEELAEAVNLIPEGEYTAKLEDFDSRLSSLRGKPYIQLRFTFAGKVIFGYCNLAGQNNLPIINWAIPHLKGKDCVIRVRHKQYSDRIYTDVVIIRVIDG